MNGATQNFNNSLHSNYFLCDQEIIFNEYLESIKYNFNDINLDQNTIFPLFYIINYYLENNLLFTDKIIEIYIRYHLKKLNLDNFCSNILIDNNDKNINASFDMDNKSLVIYYNRQKYQEYYQEHFLNTNLAQYNFLINLVNINLLRICLHEISHILNCYKFLNFEQLNIVDYRFYENFNCSLKLRNHFNDNDFIMHSNLILEENQADLFSIVKFYEDFDKYFQKALNINTIFYINHEFAKIILNLYTEKTENGLVYKSPLTKFNEFYNLIFNENCILIKDNDNNFLSDLLKGNDISKNNFNHILDIANGKIKTKNLLTKYSN